MSFHVGQKVVCVDDIFHDDLEGNPTGLQLRAVYTVTKVFTTNDGFYRGGTGHLCLCLAEHENPNDWDDGAFAAERFRPVKTTDISIFKAMLVTPPKQRVRA